jgi:hypothetical protein
VTFSGTVTTLSGTLATPAPGAPIAGANVYVTTSTGVLTNGTPSPILAHATTAPDGTFITPSLNVSAFNGCKAGIVIINGAAVSATSGLTDKGFAVLHTQAVVNPGNVAVANLEIDTPSASEASGVAELEKVRANHALPSVALDEAMLEALRWSVQNNNGAGTSQCGMVTSELNGFYTNLGGVGSLTAAQDSSDSTLPAAVDALYQNPVSLEVWGAASGPVSEAGCGASQGGTAPYSQIATLNAATIF